MPDNVQSIYKTAREFAGITQERAAAALNLSVRSLAAYETGERIPHDDIVVHMVDLYNYQQLAVQHMRANSELARRIIPELKDRSLIEAAVRFSNSLRRMDRLDGAEHLLEIGEDNQIDDRERDDYNEIALEVQKLIQSAMELISASREEEQV